MIQTTWIALVLGVWSSLYLLDAFLKSHKSWSRHYIHFLDRTGLAISICQLRWYSTFLNRTFLRIGQWRPNFLKVWFTCGVVFGLLAMLLSTFLLTLLVINTFRKQPVEQQILTPVMPGINLPASQVSYYLLTLLVCGILHEVGHAVAAVREQVRVNGFGLFLLILYPGAYVDLYTDHLQVVSPIRQLRIYCAGVWHNFVIVIFSVIMLVLLPYLWVPLYTAGNAVAVTYVTENSAVSGPRGLSVGDPITSVSGCHVRNLDDWTSCISFSMRESSLGHCMAIDLVKSLDTKDRNLSISGKSEALDCCNSTSNTHLCFRFHVKTSPENSPVEQKFACLPARSTTDRPMCKFQSDCYIPNVDMVCVYPSVDNDTRLLQVHHGRKPPLLFLGHPLDLHYSVSLSNFVPRFSFVPVGFPDMVETFSKYLISLSGALVILNVVPCYALDGQWICSAFIELSLRSTIPDRDTRGIIFTVILLYGTGLLFVNVVIAMWTLFS
ncbi:membrane-bound transcription factor site-2 protease-like isoform X1 [Mizuhopecten yessoensis]|uniref:membrane-bound transcription factor site-2 protease-like isoform X1 n=1 Tax=Mizuhopecten yessoensis TaxID=6573 RepID=UPI000B45C024|nr:membrane-bound transcription factor site-2 protease-like isoform X1 [Mizuhopecten yessoensis]